GAGELLVVLGPAGAGKTTLLRVLAGLERPDSGRILEQAASPREGHAAGAPIDVAALPPHRRDVAMVFENFALYPHMRVGENLRFPLSSKALAIPRAEAEARVRQVATVLGLADKLDRWPHELSSGEQQRVALGRALARRPKLFLLDEPLARLDAKLRERMVVEIRRLQRMSGASMVYATHDHAEALGLADRVLVLDRGRVLQDGSPEEIYHHPAESRVARLLGRPAINILSVADAARLGLTSDPAPACYGVRPESWKVTPDPAGPAVVKRVEFLGPRLALLLDVGGIPLRALISPSSRLKAGDRARLGLDPAEVHAFPR
ncbi:MAG TPA: ABC transporter ATP-binding protein, partial [Fibrobacteria bacterium]|nr:ABC transporter ATP-binding protein [Fibrobacteria bacterium]